MREVRVVLDVDGYLILVGSPDLEIPKKDAVRYLKERCQILYMTIDEFKEKKYIWVWDKEKL